MSLGSRLRELRLKRGLTQEDIGLKLSLGRANISNYEADRTQPPSDVIASIADMLKTSTDYLLMRTENPFPVDTPCEGWLIEIAQEDWIIEIAQATDAEKQTMKEIWEAIKKMQSITG